MAEMAGTNNKCTTGGETKPEELRDDRKTTNAQSICISTTAFYELLLTFDERM